MTADIQHLYDILPRSAQIVANHVYHSVSTGQITSNETRSALALSAGLREVVESYQTDNLIHTGIRYPKEFTRLLGFADAHSRKAIAARLNANPMPAQYIAVGIGSNRLSHSRRINGIFRQAIQYAETI